MHNSKWYKTTVSHSDGAQISWTRRYQGHYLRVQKKEAELRDYYTAEISEMVFKGADIDEGTYHLQNGERLDDEYTRMDAILALEKRAELKHLGTIKFQEKQEAEQSLKERAMF